MAVYVKDKSRQVLTLLFFLIVFNARTLEYSLDSCDLWGPEEERTAACQSCNTSDIYLVGMRDLGCVSVWLFVSRSLCVCVCVCVCVCECVAAAALLSPCAQCCGGDKIASQHSYFRSAAKHPSSRSQNPAISASPQYYRAPSSSSRQKKKPSW